MHYDFELAGRRVRLWQRTGESYEHVLMKALGYAMFVGEFPALEIERRVGLRYKPDLVTLSPEGASPAPPFAFWGECGQTAVRKTAWLLKHAGVGRLVLFKMRPAPALVEELRAAVDERYRAHGRLVLINFVPDILAHTRERRIARVPESWYATTVV